MGLLKSLFATADEPPKVDIRETLFGDMHLDQWTGNGSTSQAFPWSTFAAARNHIGHSNKEAAVSKWHEIVGHAGLEPRHYLQAWFYLRLAGHQPPPAIARQVLGVVVEVGMDKGLDLLAAYPDYSARYYNFSGSGVVWEHPTDEMNSTIDKLLNAATRAVAHIGPWQAKRPPAPPNGQVRLNFLTPSGLHFGQAGMDVMAKDQIGGEAFYWASVLMRALIAFSNRPPASTRSASLHQ